MLPDLERFKNLGWLSAQRRERAQRLDATERDTTNEYVHLATSAYTAYLAHFFIGALRVSAEFR
jgi:hypothetical protein